MVCWGDNTIGTSHKTVFLTNIIDNITLLGVFPKSSNMHLALHPSHSNYKIDLNNLVTLSHTTMDFDTTFSEDNMLEKSNWDVNITH